MIEQMEQFHFWLYDNSTLFFFFFFFPQTAQLTITKINLSCRPKRNKMDFYTLAFTQFKNSILIILFMMVAI